MITLPISFLHSLIFLILESPAIPFAKKTVNCQLKKANTSLPFLNSSQFPCEGDRNWDSSYSKFNSTPKIRKSLYLLFLISILSSMFALFSSHILHLIIGMR